MANKLAWNPSTLKLAWTPGTERLHWTHPAGQPEKRYCLLCENDTKWLELKMTGIQDVAQVTYYDPNYTGPSNLRPVYYKYDLDAWSPANELNDFNWWLEADEIDMNVNPPATGCVWLAEKIIDPDMNTYRVGFYNSYDQLISTWYVYSIACRLHMVLLSGQPIYYASFILAIGNGGPAYPNISTNTTARHTLIARRCLQSGQCPGDCAGDWIILPDGNASIPWSEIGLTWYPPAWSWLDLDGTTVWLTGEDGP